MNETYAAYLQSQAWMEKRAEAIARSEGKCVACGSASDIQVHHLTYARIFREEVRDLAVLCRVHHEAAEEMIRKQVISRTGDPSVLLEQTLRYIAPAPRGYVPKTIHANPTKFEKVGSWLRLPKKEFREHVKALFRGTPFAKKCVNESIGRWNRENGKRAKKNAVNPVKNGAPATIETLAISTRGWTKEKLSEYGISWPPPKGWRKRLMASGMKVS